MKEIDLTNTDPDFKDLVAAKIGLEVIKPCYTCGSCTGICPVREVIDDFVVPLVAPAGLIVRSARDEHV